MYFISRYETKNGVVTNELEIEKSMFKMSPGFTVDALIITGILVALYPVFW
jgi:SSS family solute:Na+ symporter